MTNLSGTWLGTYCQDNQPTRLEASLIHSGNSLSGNILDDSWLGEAQIASEVVGKHLQFTKQYLSARSETIDYSGTIDDDDTMQGIWTIAGTTHPERWEARRSNKDLRQELKQRTERQVALGISSPTGTNSSTDLLASAGQSAQHNRK